MSPPNTPNNPPQDHQNLFLLLGRIDGKLDSALERLARHEEDYDHLAGRVRTLEESNATASGTAVGTRKGTIVGLSIGSGLSGAAILEAFSKLFNGIP